MKKVFIVFAVLSVMVLAISLASAGEVPLAPWCPSNADLWQYQFAGYLSHTNANCGQVSMAMVIQYLTGKRIDVSYQQQNFGNAGGAGVHSLARWLYSQDNGHPRGYSNNDESDPGSTPDQIIDALSYEGISARYSNGADASLNAIATNINNGKVMIARVSACEYRSTPCALNHWVMVYGHDPDNIIINDPGYDGGERWGRGRVVSKVKFQAALNAVGNELIVVDTTLANSTPGRFADGWHGSQCPDSQAFVDAYNAAGGYRKLGMPPNGNYVRCWPDGCSNPNNLYVQDLRTIAGYWSQLVYNGPLGKTFVVEDSILRYWNSYSGYSNFGSPLGDKVQATYNGQSWWVQKFQKMGAGRVRILGSNQSNTALVREFSSSEIRISTVGGGDDDDDEGPPEITPPTLPCYNQEQTQALGYDYFLNGKIMNGKFNSCILPSFRVYYCDTNGGASTGCNQGYDTMGPNNCVASFYTSKLGTRVSRYHMQLTNMDGYPLNIQAGKTYYFSAWMKSTVPRKVTVALTPRATYDHFGLIIQLTDILAPVVEFQLDTKWRHYGFHFKATRTDPTGAIRIFSGDKVGGVQMDDAYFDEYQPPVPNATPQMKFQNDEFGGVYVTLDYGSNGNLLGLFGNAVSPNQAATISAFVADYGVYDKQVFDPYGNIMYLPSDGNFDRAGFYITDLTGADHWVNYWLWQVTGAVPNGDWLDYSNLVPEVTPPQISFYYLNGFWQGEIKAQADSSGYLIGLFGDPIRPQDAATISVFVANYGMWVTQVFYLTGNYFNLPDNFDSAGFYITDTRGVDHWVNYWLWQVSGATPSGDWLKWR